MSTNFYKEYEEFCSATTIKYIETGTFFGDEWRHKSLKAPYNRLYIVLEGEGNISSGVERYPITAGNAYIIPLGYDFDCDSHIYMKKIFFHFLAPNIYDVDTFENQKRILTIPIETNMYTWIYRSLENHCNSDYLRIRIACDTLINSFIEDETFQKHDKINQNLAPRLKEINKLVNQHLSAQLKISWIASKIGISHVALSKYYRVMTNSVLKEVILDKLMHKAQVLLLTETKSIAEIAEELGYVDTLYFSKVFHKRIGLPPSQYRKKNKIKSNVT